MNYDNMAGAVLGQAAQSLGIGAEASKRQLELPSAIDRLEKALNFAEESINSLRTRLDHGALRPDAPPSTKESSNQISPAPPSSGYANAVYMQGDRASQLGHRVQDLLRRLEV